MTTVGVDAVQTTLPHGPDQPPESVLGTELHNMDCQLRESRAVRLSLSGFDHLSRTVGVTHFRLIAGSFIIEFDFHVILEAR